MLIQVTSTLAQSPIGSDLLRNSVFRLSDADRAVTGAYLQQTGSPTMRGAIQLFVSDILIADLQANDDAAQGLQMFPIDAPVYSGSELRALVTSPITGGDAMILTIQIDEMMEDEGELEF